MTEPKLIIGTPYQLGADGEMAAPFMLFYGNTGWTDPTVTVALTTRTSKGNIKIAKREIAVETFYEFREAVNNLYDHIRQETPTD